MSFWDLSDGDSAATGAKEYEAPTGNLDPIPDNSNVLATIEEAKWNDDKDMNRYMSIKWRVSEPEEFDNRVLFQKLWVLDLDPNAKADKAEQKRDRAKRMLAAIDANAGGKLARKSGIPNDDDLALALHGKAMVIKCMVWTMTGSDGQENSGNWISAVFAKGKELSVGERKPQAAKPAAKASGGFKDDLDDDIPF